MVHESYSRIVDSQELTASIAQSVYEQRAIFVATSTAAQYSVVGSRCADYLRLFRMPTSPRMISMGFRNTSEQLQLMRRVNRVILETYEVTQAIVERYRSLAPKNDPCARLIQSDTRRRPLDLSNVLSPLTIFAIGLTVATLYLLIVEKRVLSSFFSLVFRIFVYCGFVKRPNNCR